MLFNSFEFIFTFLPITLLGFFLIGKFDRKDVATTWLVVASLFYYGWWNPNYLVLISSSMVFNFWIGTSLNHDSKTARHRKQFLAFGVSANLCLLGYFKYANFFVDNLNLISGGNYNLERIILPLAISFFTFQQIAYLVDAYRGETKEYRFIHYCLFVTFFPQLIAGPIVHHKEMMPQFSKPSVYRPQAANFAIGLTVFSIGLFKKVILADTLGEYARPVFAFAETAHSMSLFEAWGGALAYTFQLYFDFSGYADMAIGVARMFGIKLPLNFNSPYKATNISIFWQRWHMTLSRFLRDYLYFPLGGNRKGEARRSLNLFVTMTFGGMWHGAGWTFIFWGVLHGLYLTVYHLWAKLLGKSKRQGTKEAGRIKRTFARALTFIAVVIGWVLFRAESFSGAWSMLKGMAGVNGIEFPSQFRSLLKPLADQLDFISISSQGGVQSFPNNWGFVWIVVAMAIAMGLPNTQEIVGEVQFKNRRAAPSNKIRFSQNLGWGAMIATLAMYSVFSINKLSEFLYFQF